MKAESTLDFYGLGQDDATRFRVHFWEQPKPGYGFNLEAWILNDAPDVHAALTWADSNSRGRGYELFVETTGDLSDAYLVRVAGTNPNTP